MAATLHSHVGSQVLGEVRHCNVDVFLWQLFPDGVQGDFLLISCLRLNLMVLYASMNAKYDAHVHLST